MVREHGRFFFSDQKRYNFIVQWSGFFHLETKSFLIFSILILTQNEKHDHLNLQKNFRIFKQGENSQSFLINNNNSWATLKIKHNYGFLG